MSQIKALRKQLGLTQEQLGQFLEVGHTQVSQAEKGKRKLSDKPLMKLALLSHCLQQAKEALPSKAEPEQVMHCLQLLHKKMQQIEGCSNELLWLDLMLATMAKGTAAPK